MQLISIVFSALSFIFFCIWAFHVVTVNVSPSELRYATMNNRRFAQWLHLGHRCVFFPLNSTKLNPVPSQMRGEKLRSAPILNYVTLVLSPTRICISVWCCEVLAIVEILSAEILFVDTIIHLPATATARSLSAGRCLNLRRVEVAGRRHSVGLSLSTVSSFCFPC